jgi:hypothetical protein
MFLARGEWRPESFCRGRIFNMTELVTQAQLKELLTYARKTGRFYWRRSRGGNRRGTEAGTVEGTGYIRISIGNRHYMAHRLAWLYVHGEHPIGPIDHRNGIRGDNRIVNLRTCIGPENQWNRRRRPNPTGYTGVYRRPSGKFAARIMWYRRSFHIGTYPTAEEAARNYDVHAECLFGPFARTNGSLAKFKAIGKTPDVRRRRGRTKRAPPRPLGRKSPANASRGRRNRGSIRREGIQSPPPMY